MVISEQEKVIMFKFQAPETKNIKSPDFIRKMEHNELTLDSVQELKTASNINAYPTGYVSTDNEAQNHFQVIQNFIYFLLLYNDVL